MGKITAEQVWEGCRELFDRAADRINETRKELRVFSDDFFKLRVAFYRSRGELSEAMARIEKTIKDADQAIENVRRRNLDLTNKILKLQNRVIHLEKKVEKRPEGRPPGPE